MMKVEEMLGKAKDKLQNEDKWNPHDAISNPLSVGDFVVIGWNNMGPLVGRVIEIQKGGVSTPQGMLPTRTRVVLDMTLITGPKDQGAHMARNVIKTVNPLSQPLVEAIADMNLPVRG